MGFGFLISMYSLSFFILFHFNYNLNISWWLWKIGRTLLAAQKRIKTSILSTEHSLFS